MTKKQLFVSQLVAFTTGVALALYGWICHVPEAAAVGVPMFVGAVTAWGVQRPKDVS